jgi:hypothetical protein
MNWFPVVKSIELERIYKLLKRDVGLAIRFKWKRPAIVVGAFARGT